MAAERLVELDVRAVREPAVILDRRADGGQVKAVHALALDHAVRVPERDELVDRRRRVAPVRPVIRPVQGRDPGIDRDAAAVDRPRDGALRRLQRHLGAPVAVGHVADGDATAVPGELGGAPVRVQDLDAHVPRPDRIEHEDAVAARPQVGVADALHARRRKRCREVAALDHQVRVPGRLPLLEPHRRGGYRACVFQRGVLGTSYYDINHRGKEKHEHRPARRRADRAPERRRGRT